MLNPPNLLLRVDPRALTNWFLICFLAVFLGSIATANGQSFSAPASYDAGTNPNAVVAGDFNLDGKLDLAVSNYFTDNVSVVLNNGDNTFRATVNYAADTHPQSVTTGDFNKDGKLDLAVGNFDGGVGTGNISILLGKGDGTFQAAVNYDAKHPADLKVADVNRDGNLDLVVASSGVAVSILLGNGDGSFRAATTYSAGTTPVTVEIADFNRDGKLDLAVADYGASIKTLIGNGDGTFQGSVSQPTAGYYGVGVADLNGDGKPDFVAQANSAVVVFLGNGDGSFQTPVSYAAGNNIYPGPPALGDLNGDGKLDIAVGNFYDGVVLVLRGNGDGTFQTAASHPSKPNPTYLIANDLNSDGKLDLAIASGSSPKVNVMLNSPSARGVAISATAGAVTNNVMVATFIDYDTTKTAGSFTATINWGDGTSPTAGVVSANGSGGFNVNGSHTYAKEGSYLPVVQIADTVGNFASATATATVADAPLTAIGKTINAIQGAPFNLVVASFTDADPSGQVSEFSATINWGDGTATSAGVITAGGGGFNVNGSHTYASTGSFSISVAIADVGGSTASANSSATVSPPVIQFSQPTYTANEGDGSVQITVVRTGDSPNSTNVDFATSDGTANAKKDYGTALGTISFSPGQSSRTFSVLLTDNGFVDGSRTLALTLTNPVNCVLGVQTSSTLTIQDNDTSPGNPVDDATFFVRQHYHDFLNREPDQTGLQFWVSQITSCGNDAQCVEVKRINVSAAFYLSIEFQNTGFFAVRIQRVAFGRKSKDGTRMTYSEILSAITQIGNGVVVLAPGWEAKLEANKQAYAEQIVASSQFISKYPTNMTADAYVDALVASASVPVTAGERQAAISACGSGNTSGRASALRVIAEAKQLTESGTETGANNAINREFREAFVLMQYIGYLRRDPDQSGSDFWLQKLNNLGGSYTGAEMVKAFLASSEYRQRFGP